MREDGQRTGFILGKTPGAQRILLYDDFEGLFKWKIGVNRIRATTSKHQGKVFDGNYALRLYSGATIPNGAQEGYAYRGFPISALSTRMRFELVWYRPDPSAFSYGFYWVHWVDGIQTIAGWRWAYGSRHWWYVDPAGDWTYTLGMDQLLGKDCWHRVAFDIDLDSGRYVSLESDGGRFDVSGFSFRRYSKVLPIAGGGLRIATWVSGPGCDQWYDDVLVRTV